MAGSWRVEQTRCGMSPVTGRPGITVSIHMRCLERSKVVGMNSSQCTECHVGSRAEVTASVIKSQRKYPSQSTFCSMSLLGGGDIPAEPSKLLLKCQYTSIRQTSVDKFSARSLNDGESTTFRDLTLGMSSVVGNCNSRPIDA